MAGKLNGSQLRNSQDNEIKQEGNTTGIKEEICEGISAIKDEPGSGMKGIL